MSLRNELIRLAHSKPELRKDLLPLLKVASNLRFKQKLPDLTVVERDGVEIGGIREMKWHDDCPVWGSGKWLVLGYQIRIGVKWEKGFEYGPFVLSKEFVEYINHMMPEDENESELKHTLNYLEKGSKSSSNKDLYSLFSQAWKRRGSHFMLGYDNKDAFKRAKDWIGKNL